MKLSPERVVDVVEGGDCAVRVRVGVGGWMCVCVLCVCVDLFFAMGSSLTGGACVCGVQA